MVYSPDFELNSWKWTGTKEGKILVFGSRPSGKIVNVPKSAPCKFVQIASLVFRLLCVGTHIVSFALFHNRFTVVR